MVESVRSRLKQFIQTLLIGKTDSNVIQFLRYAAASGVSLLVDFSALYVFTEYVGLHYLVSTVIGYMLGMVVNYFLSTGWVFSKKRFENKAVEFSIFALIGLLGMGLNELSVWFFTEIVMLHYMLSRSISAVIGYLWKYVIRKIVLFSGK